MSSSKMAGQGGLAVATALAIGPALTVITHFVGGAGYSAVMGGRIDADGIGGAIALSLMYAYWFSAAFFLIGGLLVALAVLFEPRL